MNHDDLTRHLLTRLREVQRNLGGEPTADDQSHARFADVIDSMGMVEFLALIADDCGVKPEAIEKAVGHNFETIAALASALSQAGLAPRAQAFSLPNPTPGGSRSESASAWLAGAAFRLADTIEMATEVDKKLNRPAGWFQEHAGIRQRRTWGGQDPLAAAVTAAHEALERSGLTSKEVGALLVVSEAPPILLGLAAALHHRLQLSTHAIALEIGGACTAFLAALWTAQAVLPRRELVLVISVEAPTLFLHVQPGKTGEAAALFGDAAAAAALCSATR